MRGRNYGSEEGGKYREAGDAELTKLQDAKFRRRIAMEEKWEGHIEEELSGVSL